MGFVRCRQQLFLTGIGCRDWLPLIASYKRMPFSLLTDRHFALSARIRDEKLDMALREKIQRRFPPKIGRFLL